MFWRLSSEHAASIQISATHSFETRSLQVLPYVLIRLQIVRGLHRSIRMRVWFVPSRFVGSLSNCVLCGTASVQRAFFDHRQPLFQKFRRRLARRSKRPQGLPASGTISSWSAAERLHSDHQQSSATTGATLQQWQPGAPCAVPKAAFTIGGLKLDANGTCRADATGPVTGRVDCSRDIQAVA